MSTTVYSPGMVHLSVCTDDTVETMLGTVNATHPTGLSHGWTVSDESFASGDPNPCPCNTDPASRHYLLVC